MNQLTTSISELTLDNDGVLHVRLNEGAVVDLEALKANFVAYHQLLGDKRALILIDSRVTYTYTKEAREYAAGNDVPINRVAVAFLVNSIPSKWVTNVFISLNQPVIPTRMFTSKEKALNWLHSFYILPGEKGKVPKPKKK